MLYDVVEMVQGEGWSIVAYLGSLAGYSKSRVLSVSMSIRGNRRGMELDKIVMDFSVRRGWC